jgi:hypothetical protein
VAKMQYANNKNSKNIACVQSGFADQRVTGKKNLKEWDLSVLL